MVFMTRNHPTTMDGEYVAACIATELVRLHISSNHHLRSNAQAHNVSMLLTMPLESVANALGVGDRVNELVSNALSVVDGATSRRGALQGLTSLDD